MTSWGWEASELRLVKMQIPCGNYKKIKYDSLLQGLPVALYERELAAEEVDLVTGCAASNL